MTAAIVARVTRGSINRGGQPVIGPLDLTIETGSVLALLGPGGAGKSTLLATMAHQPPADGWRREGTWELAIAADQLFYLPQPRGGERNRNTLARVPSRTLLLLDEPGPTSTPEQRSLLAGVLRERAGGGSAVVVVTHDLSFARLVADRVVLLVEGRLLADLPKPDFFASTDPLVGRFVAQGNVSLPPSPPTLPSHFCWVLPSELAGMGKPGLLGNEEEDLEAIAAAGIQILVTLTETAPAATRLRPLGIEGWQLPIRDMGIPAMAPLVRLCRDIDRVLRQGRPVAVHCHAGLGRTGLVLACMLIWRGQSPQSAVTGLRANGRGYIQSEAQMSFLDRFAAEIGAPRC